MKEIGAYLKQARVKNGVSLEEVSEDLNISIVQLENIEEGNARAFKDVFSLRDYVKDYAKYLGLNVNKLSDEFNDFMFERTSKISLAQIKNKKGENVNTKKDQIASPYTKIPIRKDFPIKPVLGILVGIVIFMLLILVIIRLSSKDDPMTNELLGNGSEVYEFTY